MQLFQYFFLFYQFISTHNKTYDEATFNTRFPIFVENYKFIHQMNQNDNLTFSLGVNKFADLTSDEFKNLHLGLQRSNSSKCGVFADNGSEAPDSIDWRLKNALTPVKDQGQCGSCWAFAAAGFLEDRFCIASGGSVNVRLSR